MRTICLWALIIDLKYSKRNSLYNYKGISSKKLYYMHHKQNRPLETLHSRWKSFQKYIDMVEKEESGQGINVWFSSLTRYIVHSILSPIMIIYFKAINQTVNSVTSYFELNMFYTSTLFMSLLLAGKFIWLGKIQRVAFSCYLHSVATSSWL